MQEIAFQIDIFASQIVKFFPREHPLEACPCGALGRGYAAPKTRLFSVDRVGIFVLVRLRINKMSQYISSQPIAAK